MTETTSIDDLLVSAKTTSQPEAPEHQPEMESNEYGEEAPELAVESHEKSNDDAEVAEDAPTQSYETDDYGNEPEPENKGIRERLERQAKRHQAEMDALRAQLTVNQAPQVQQASKGFEYNPEEAGDWQQQLESFVEQTVSRMNGKQQQQQQQMHEQQVQRAFHDKFTAGMDRFADFRDVVEAQPFTDPMTQALRGINDPSAFVYAASKRHPQELERISKIPDHYAQMVEIGKLEERMKKTAAATKAPRPVSQTREDAGMKHSEKKGEPSIEDMIAQAESRKIAKMKQRYGK